jgi:hypothetical protein
MFNKIFKLGFGLLMLVLFITNISEAQTKKEVYPVFSISPLGGVQFPVGGLNDTYGVSWNAGAEVSMKINRETAFFLNGSYFNLPIKSGADAPNASYIAITAGPRYYFGGPKLKAKFFMEAGVGMYMFTIKEHTFTNGAISPSVTATYFGANTGPGVTIPLGGSVDMLMKAKLHYTFHEGGSHTFLSTVAAIEFRL